MQGAAEPGIELSVIIPVYNEEEVLPKLFPALRCHRRILYELSVAMTGLFFFNRLVPGFTLFGYSVGASRGVATIVILVSLVSAINFFCLAIIGQYLSLVLREVKRRPQAIVQELVGNVQRQPVAYPLNGNE